jgi:hypothetical protein
MLSPWLGVVPVVGVVTVIRAAASRGGKKRRDGLHAREDRYGVCLILVVPCDNNKAPHYMFCVPV